MESKPFALGDLVSIKNHSLKDEHIFIWDIIKEGNQEELVVNVPLKHLNEMRFKNVENKTKHRLFSTYEYVYVKGYDLYREDDSVLGKDYDFLKEIIEIRGSYNFMAELVFLFLLESIKDKRTIDRMMLEFIPAVVNDPYSILPAIEIESFNADRVTSLLQNVLAPIILRGNCFWLMKRMKNFSTIASSIITEDGRSMLQRITEDRALLESLLDLFNGKENYKTATYAPFNTKTTRPISHGLSQSFYAAFHEEVENFSKLQQEKKQWIENADSIQKQMVPENVEENLLSGCFPEMQRLLFSGLGEEIPVEKLVDDQPSVDYNLAFYIPFFQWLMPEVFSACLPNMKAFDVRKYHIRKIKDFTQGKI